MGEDLRVVKTKRAIRAAFLELRVERPLDKMRVCDICDNALINKSTFYHHYDDVFDLSDKIEDETLARCFDGFGYRGCLLTDPLVFLKNVPDAMASQGDVLHVLFSGRLDTLSFKIMRDLRALYRSESPSAAEDVLLAFVIGGALYAMQTLSAEGIHAKEEVTEESAKLISLIAQSDIR